MRREPATSNGHIAHPAKVFRLASMARCIATELRQEGDGLDDGARERARAFYQSSLHELRDLLSDELRDELDLLVKPLRAQDELTGSELLVAETQLSG